MTRTVVEELVVSLVGEGSSFRATMDAAVQQSRAAMDSVGALAGGIERRTKNSLEGMAGFLRNFSAQTMSYLGVLGTVAGAGGIVSQIGKGISLANEAESNEIAFGTMLKSAEKGKQMVEDLQALGAKTPMDTGSLQQATKTMLQFGVSGKNVLPILEMLGNAVGGDAQKLQQLSLAFGQMSSTGRLMGGDLFQMVNAGFNPLQEMAENRAKKQGGTAEKYMPGLKKEMEAGKISVQMVTESFKRASAEGGQFAGLMEKQSQSIAGLFSTMKDDIDGVLRTLGKDVIEAFNVRGFIKEVSKAAQAAKAWLEGISPETKKAFASFVTALGAIGALVAALFALKGVFLLVWAASPFAPFIAAAGALVAVVYKLIDSVGGVAKAWDLVRAAGLRAWDWLLPIRRNLMFMWDGLLEAANAAWAGIAASAAQFYNWLLGNTTTTWGQVKDAVIDAMITAEFFFRNIGPISAASWAFIKMSAVGAFNVLVWQVTEVLPAAFQYLRDNAHAIIGSLWDWWSQSSGAVAENVANSFFNIKWSDVWEGMKQGFKNVIDHIKFVADNLGRILTGGMSFSDVWNELGQDGAASVAKEIKKIPEMVGQVKVPPFKIPDRVPTQLEDQLRAEFESQKNVLQQSYDDFRQERLADIYTEALPEDAKKKAEQTGLEIGKAVSDGAGKGIQKVDASLAGSADAIAKVIEYQEMLNATGGDKYGVKPVQEKYARDKREEEAAERRRITYRFNASGRQIVAGCANGPEPVLKDILNELKKGNEKPGLNMEAAAFA